MQPLLQTTLGSEQNQYSLSVGVSRYRADRVSSSDADWSNFSGKSLFYLWTHCPRRNLANYTIRQCCNGLGSKPMWSLKNKTKKFVGWKQAWSKNPKEFECNLVKPFPQRTKKRICSLLFRCAQSCCLKLRTDFSILRIKLDKEVKLILQQLIDSTICKWQIFGWI